MIKSAKITYMDISENGDYVGCQSFTHMVKNHGSKVTSEIIHCFKVVNERAVRADEVTCFKADVDMGSRALRAKKSPWAIICI
jgi:hypothetical protein